MFDHKVIVCGSCTFYSLVTEYSLILLMLYIKAYSTSIVIYVQCI